MSQAKGRRGKVTKSAPAVGRKLTHKKKATKKAFLSAYGEACSISAAAEAAGLARQTHYNWLASDEAYKAAFLKMQEQAAQLLEDEAVRRAYQGVERPVTVAGKREVVKEYSDTLLIFLLKGLRPDKYRERSEIRATVATNVADVIPARRAARLKGEL
jgi:hypothetical protein